MLPVHLLLTFGRLSLVRGDIAQAATICTSDYGWMGTSKGASPCQVAASLNALCNKRNWIIPALNISIHYTNPSTKDGTATWCTCSWASYNTISACTACQGYPARVAFWSNYTADCTGLTSDTYWPTRTISTDITIPYWASRDPTKWTKQSFNSTEARDWTSYADLTLSPSSSPVGASPTPDGAIVGAIIGGLVVITFVIWITRRHRQRRASESAGVVARPDVITPYVLPPMDESPDNKQSNDEWPMFDPPNAPPQRVEVFPSQAPAQQARCQCNPPAYSESDPNED